MSIKQIATTQEKSLSKLYENCIFKFEDLIKYKNGIDINVKYVTGPHYKCIGYCLTLYDYYLDSPVTKSYPNISCSPNSVISIFNKCRTKATLSLKLLATLSKYNTLPKNSITKEGEKNMSNIENTLIRGLGIRGLVSNAEVTTVSFIAKNIKTKFGIEMIITNPVEVKTVTDWIKKYDNKFKNHISNPYTLSGIHSDEPRLDSCFIIHITKATYVYINARSNTFRRPSNDDDHVNYNPIYMYIFGKKCYAVFNSLSKYIRNQIKSDEMMYSIVGESNGDKSYWKCTASSLVSRQMDTIFMSDEKKKRIIDHLDQWSANEDMYNNRGLLYKTGILLYGTPGTGKSSMAIAIANYMKCALITIDPTTFHHLNIAEIVDAIVADECTYVVLIDEIDAIFKSRDDENISTEQVNKTAKLLSLLDSQQSPTNVVFVATTNYYDRLDPALTRPGRFDIIEELGNIDKSIAKNMCKSFNIPDDTIEDILSSFDTDDINPSRLQDKILQYLKLSQNDNIENSDDNE